MAVQDGAADLPTRCQWARCRSGATSRLAQTVGGWVLPIVPLCAYHAQAVQAAVARRDWSMTVEQDWGGPLLDGRQARAGRRR